MKWDYKIQYLMKNVSDQEARNEAVLNTLGKKGWELVSVDNNLAYLKRQRGLGKESENQRSNRNCKQ